ncbi:MAG TPA: hypothetical protein PKN50_14225 [Spirochaetota bacterium]|nr:hypothetical protein [Spirochaetota bacterium]HPV40563.1 hypothetical protein [Spirochaetota bacterium]
MFEKTKLIMTLTFTLCFLSYSFLVGRFYDKFHMSRSAMIVICAVTTAAVAVSFIADVIAMKRAREQATRNKE